MKTLLLSITLLISCTLIAQVGIGTTSPTAELDIDTSNSTLPPLMLNPQIAPSGNAAGQLSVIGEPGLSGQIIGGDLYLYDTSRTKWLSVESSTFNFGLEGSLNNAYLEYAGDIISSGPRMAKQGSIVYLTINSSGGNLSKRLTLRVYDSFNNVVSSHSLQLVNGRLLRDNININFSAGDYFRVKVDNDGGANVNDASVVLWTKWRK